MVLYKDRRLFKRYKQKTDFYIIIEDNYYKAATVDFSLTGLCIFIEGKPPVTLDSFIDLKIEEIDLDVRGRVMWIKDTGTDLLVGIEKMSILGILKFYSLSDILLDLQRSDITGTLEIGTDPIYKSIYIKNGVMVFASSNQEEDHLGEVLLKAGKINVDQYYQATNIEKTTGKRLGAVLVELGFLKSNELIWALKYQVEEIILSLFTYENGTVKLALGPLPADVITLKLRTADLIFRGIKRIRNPEYFKNICPPPDAILYYSNEPLNLFQDIDIEEDDMYILTLLDSKPTFKELCDISIADKFKTTKIICGLISIRMIVTEGEKVLDDQSITKIIREPKKALDSAFIDKVEDLYTRYKHLDYYIILGIEKSANQTQIRKAYYLIAKEFHPDRYFQTGSETLKNKLSAIFAYAVEAYKTLSDPKMREQYDQSLKAPVASERLRNEAQSSHTKFQHGINALKKGNFAVAAELFGQAAYMDSRVGDYHYYQSIAYRKLKRFHDAQKALSQALKLEPFNADYIAESGNIYLGLGFYLRSKAAFEKALKSDANNRAAVDGLKKVTDYLNSTT